MPVAKGLKNIDIDDYLYHFSKYRRKLFYVEKVENYYQTFIAITT
jgi:hypothetical protein